MGGSSREGELVRLEQMEQGCGGRGAREGGVREGEEQEEHVPAGEDGGGLEEEE